MKYNMKRLSVNKSGFKKEINEFIKSGGSVHKLPPEVEWEMFPYFDDSAILRNKNEKGILDYEESCKPLRSEVLTNE